MGDDRRIEQRGRLQRVFAGEQGADVKPAVVGDRGLVRDMVADRIVVPPPGEIDPLVAGIEVGVFGDIDVDSHREWVRRVCAVAGIVPVHPLWKRNRRELLEEFIGLGFRAQIVVINEQKLDKNFLGKTIEAQAITEMEETGIDPSGELGEYHTVVTDGPMFSSRVEIKTAGQEHHEGYWFLKVGL